MNPIIILALVLLFLLIIILGLSLIFWLKNKDKKPIKKYETNKEQVKKDSEILKLIQIAKNQKSSENDLFNISKFFIDNFKFPKKENLSNEDKKEIGNYLKFIMLIAAHKNTNAKIISFLGSEAKKKNPSYIIEIERYENEGISNSKK